MRFDLLFQMHGNGTIVNNLLARFEAWRWVGFCPDGLLSDADWLVYLDGIHEMLKHLRLLEHLGLQVSFPGDAQIEFPVSDREKEDFERWRTANFLGMLFRGRKWKFFLLHGIDVADNLVSALVAIGNVKNYFGTPC